jgi:hypothetical protein
MWKRAICDHDDGSILGSRSTAQSINVPNSLRSSTANSGKEPFQARIRPHCESVIEYGMSMKKLHVINVAIRSLCEIDQHGLRLRIGPQSKFAHLPANSAFLGPAEGTGHIDSANAVDSDNAGVYRR